MRLSLLVAVATGIMVGLPDRTGQASSPPPVNLDEYHLLMTSPTLSAPMSTLIPLEKIDIDRLCREASWVVVVEQDTSEIDAATITGLIIHEVIRAPADSTGFKRIRCWNSPGAYLDTDVLWAVPKRDRRSLLFANSKEGMLIPIEGWLYRLLAREEFIRKHGKPAGNRTDQNAPGQVQPH